MKKLLGLFSIVFALVVNGISAGYPVLVAYPPDAESVTTDDGSTWYFFTMPPPASPGLYDWSVSFDAGATWHTLQVGMDFSALSLVPENNPIVTVWVNPLIQAPYVWYRYTPSVPANTLRSRKARK